MNEQFFIKSQNMLHETRIQNRAACITGHAKLSLKKLSLLFALFLFCPALFAVNYDITEIRQLVTFLNQPSGEQGKTNAGAIGIPVQVTEINVAEWERYLSIYIKSEGGIDHIRDISLENKGDFRLAGSFSIENFKCLKTLSLYGMGSEVKVKNCPELGEFRLMGKFRQEHCKERRLEIIACPKLWRFRIDCLVTEFILNGSTDLEEVNISYTDFPAIDFSAQIKLKWLILPNNAFSEINIPEANKWSLECQDNRIEPADLMKIIRKHRGDDLYLDWRFPTTEYTPQQIICYDPISHAHSVSVGTKVDLREKATFKYGNPEKTYTGTFKWQYKKTESWGGTTMVDISANTGMKQGVYTIPAGMANRTIVVSYNCEPFFTGDKIQYIINVVP